MPETLRYRRKQYFVARKFQLKYIGLILLLVALTGLMCSYVIYYTMMLTLGDKLANVYPQGRLISIVNMVNWRILLSIVLVAPLVIAIGVFASHKIAGPVFRIEKFLGAMSEGNFSEPIVLRRNDELISLANGINKVVDSMKVTIKKERSHLASITSSMENLRKIAETKPINHSALDRTLDKLNEEVSTLNREIEKYKV